MAERTQLELYGLFQNGRAPTEQDFRDLIDTLFAGSAATMAVAQAAQTTANQALAVVTGSNAIARGLISYTTSSGHVSSPTVQVTGCTAVVSGTTCTVVFTTPPSGSYTIQLNSQVAPTGGYSIVRNAAQFSFTLPTVSSSTSTHGSVDFVCFPL